MRDMIPPGSDRSIRNIPVSPNHRRAVTTQPPMHIPEDPRDSEEEIERPRARQTKHTRPRFWLWALVVIFFCSIAGVLFSSLFDGATITVYPRMEKVDLPATLSASITPANTGLAYETVTTSTSASTTAAATGTKKISRQASGSITIYNTYSTASQRLIANTRFQAPDGKIYRIRDSVVVPGTGKNADGSAAAGTIETTVYADSPGAEYNRGATTFTIPGFQGDPRYSKFYAKTDSISGGLVGTGPAIATKDLTAAQTTLKGELQTALTAQNTTIPDGFIAVSGTTQITYGEVTQGANADGSATLSQTAKATIAIVKATDLAGAVARQKVQNYGGELVAFLEPAKVQVGIQGDMKGTNITLALSGSSILIWQFDPSTVKNALVGKSKAGFQTIILSFAPAITRAEARVRPFWRGNFPTNPAKIDIQVIQAE